MTLGRVKVKPLSQKVKVGGKFKLFSNISDCKVCNARNKNNVDIRLDIDKMLITKSEKEVSRILLNEFDLTISDKLLHNHLERHSRYVLEAKDLVIKTAENLALNQINQIEDVYIDADTVIEEIVTKGGQAIRSGDIKVDGKLLMGALKEQGVRKKVGTLQQMFTELDKGRFGKTEIAEIVPDEEVAEPLFLEDANKKLTA